MNTLESARGRWPEILSALGIDEKYLRDKHGPCPLCGGKDRYRFTDYRNEGRYFCNQCGHGSGVDLAMSITGLSFKEVCGRIDDFLGKHDPSPRVDDKNACSDTQKAREALEKVRQESVYAGEVPEVVEYLNKRGLIVPPNLYAHPSLAYWGRDENDQPRKVGEFPTMLGKLVLSNGKPVTYHRTYIHDGKKADVPSPRKMMSKTRQAKGGAIQLFPHGPVLGIAEGIETAIAAHMMCGIPVWSVVHANGMVEFNPPDGVEKVVVFGDNDASFTGQKAAYSAGHRLKVNLGLDAEVWIPEKIGDWNDALNS